MLGVIQRGAGLRVANGALLLAVVLLQTRALADESTQPVLDALVTHADRCLDRSAVAAQIVAWLRRDAIDRRIGILVAATTDGAGASFVIQRDGIAIAERQFARLPNECAELRAALGLAIALAIDATVLESLGVVDIVSQPTPAARSEPRPIAVHGESSVPSVTRRPALGVSFAFDGLYLRPYWSSHSSLSAFSDTSISAWTGSPRSISTLLR